MRNETLGYIKASQLLPVTCLCPSTDHGASVWVLCNYSSNEAEGRKGQETMQTSGLLSPAPEVTNLTQNSRKQLSIEQDGEEQGENCSLPKCSPSRAWGALEQHSSTYNFLPTEENNTADFQKITRAIARAGYSACSFVGTTAETDCVS